MCSAGISLTLTLTKLSTPSFNTVAPDDQPTWVTMTVIIIIIIITLFVYHFLKQGFTMCFDLCTISEQSKRTKQKNRNTNSKRIHNKNQPPWLNANKRTKEHMVRPYKNPCNTRARCWNWDWEDQVYKNIKRIKRDRNNEK